MAISPEQQNALMQLFNQMGGVPAEGQGMPQQAALPEGMQPGQFKDDPAGARRAIEQIMMSKATGPQLQPGATPGSYTARVPVDQPLFRLFGMKKTVPINEANYADTAQAAGISEFLPSGLARTPEGKPFVGGKAFTTALQAAQSFGPKTRADFFMRQGFDIESGEPVTFNTANNTWYKGGVKVPAKEVTRTLSNTVQNIPPAEQDRLNIINTRLQQLKSFSDTFDPKSWGLVNGSLMKTLAFYTDTDPERAEQYKNLYDIVADIVHERYGANLTSNELSQKVDSIMSKYQSPEAIKAFVKVQSARAQTEKNNRIKTLRSQKYLGVDETAAGGESVFPSGETTPKPNAAPAKLDPGTRYQQLRKSGLSKAQAYSLMHQEGY